MSKSIKPGRREYWTKCAVAFLVLVPVLVTVGYVLDPVRGHPTFYGNALPGALLFATFTAPAVATKPWRRERRGQGVSDSALPHGDEIATPARTKAIAVVAGLVLAGLMAAVVFLVLNNGS